MDGRGQRGSCPLLHAALRSAALLAVATTALALIAIASPRSARADKDSAAASAQEVITVRVGDFFFCNSSVPAEACVTTIDAGDTVVWDYASGSAGHTITHCGDSCDKPTDTPLWDSGALAPGESFTFTFGTPGVYPYRCNFHPVAMAATIVVQAGETPTATPMPEPTSTPATAATSTPTSAPLKATPKTPAQLTPAVTPAPPVGDSDDNDGVASFWFILVGIGGAAALFGGASFVWRARRAR